MQPEPRCRFQRPLGFPAGPPPCGPHLPFPTIEPDLLQRTENITTDHDLETCCAAVVRHVGAELAT
eukprot:7650151-Pyramimonas_sp.AAC.1